MNILERELGPTDGVLIEELRLREQQLRLSQARDRLLGDSNRFAFRPKAAEEAGIVRAEARVEVREGRYDDGTLCVEVAVYSLMKPGAYKRARLDRRSPTAAVQMAAGACAEGCCESYGDPFDPDQAARDSVEGYRRLREG